jgi:hypothetical protein
MYPKPTLIFYLWGDAHKLYSRKGEQSQEELFRQMEVLGELKDDFNLIKLPHKQFEALLNKVTDMIFKIRK